MAHDDRMIMTPVVEGDLRAALERVKQVLVDLDNGAHASSGRDFGRGVAYAARLITEALNPAPTAVTSPDAGDR